MLPSGHLVNNISILILKYLSELPVARILNFYIHEPEFHMGEQALGGLTAQWAQKVLLPSPPPNLMRLLNKPPILKAWLPLATKIIYALGYERDQLPAINGNQSMSYDGTSGIIAPGLFGFGIAFPEEYVDNHGAVMHKIGLAGFMRYAQRIMPQWINTKDVMLQFLLFDELFTIYAL